MTIRTLRNDERDALAELIHESTNAWYAAHLNREVFRGEAAACRIFPEVYEALDPGCCLVAEEDGELLGSCFYHPRETHVSVGIVNVRSGAARRGVARAMMERVLVVAEGRPVRLVSSLMNLDSYSLYTRLGFVPGTIFQDMVFGEGSDPGALVTEGIREARMEDVEALEALEMELSGIRRGSDFRYFLRNEAGIWHGSVCEGDAGLEGFLFSIDHPASRMLGPGAMRNPRAALALIGAEARRFLGGSPLFLVPAAATGLVTALYAAGARNCELHVAQVLGPGRVTEGIVMPTFLPETG